METTTIGIDLAKGVFAVSAADERGKVLKRSRIARGRMLPYLRGLEPCVVGMEACGGAVVPQNLIRADRYPRDSPGRANAVDFESGKRCRDGYTVLFLSRSTRRQRDASLRERTQRTADGFFDCLG